MTPAIEALKAASIAHWIHEYAHDRGTESYGLEAAEKLGVSPERVFKTLVAKLDGKQLVVGILPVSQKLNLKSLAKAAGGKKAEMAPPAEVERTTGYVLGGVSPIGQRKRLPTVIDASATACDSIFVSAGKRGLEIELATADLQQVTGASIAPIGQIGGGSDT